jgi:hypothetical protein
MKYESLLLKSVRSQCFHSDCPCKNLVFMNTHKSYYDYIISCPDCGRSWNHVVPFYSIDFVLKGN